MNLVGAHRLEHRITLGPRGHPGVVGPAIVAHGHPRRGVRGHLGAERHRIGSVDDGVIGAVHPELVQAVAREVGPEQLPHTR